LIFQSTQNPKWDYLSASASVTYYVDNNCFNLGNPEDQAIVESGRAEYIDLSYAVRMIIERVQP